MISSLSPRLDGDRIAMIFFPRPGNIPEFVPDLFKKYFYHSMPYGNVKFMKSFQRPDRKTNRNAQYLDAVMKYAGLFCLFGYGSLCRSRHTNVTATA
jgi:hypothetical protein